ncbi:MAG: PAC2 family protein, partial [Nanoarchaeota archaeon]
YKKPKGSIIIEGFPGFGLVGTIATEFLIEHLKVEQIGKIMFHEMPAMAAIHENKVVEPLGLFYSKEYNIIILHAITSSTGYEWEIADAVLNLVKETSAKEIISLEGVGSNSETSSDARVFFYASDVEKQRIFRKIGIEPLKEGIIVGVSGALLLKHEDVPITCLFTDTHTNMPDSKAAAKIIESLDKYLGLQVDSKPLLEQAERFEEKLKTILKKGQEATELSEQKRMSYVG